MKATIIANPEAGQHAPMDDILQVVDLLREHGIEVVSVDTKVFANAVKPIFERNKDTWTQAVIDKVVGAGG